MREVNRTIVSAVIFSKDKKILMGKKDPNKGGVYTDCWYIPGGGVDHGETLESALIREVKEEVGLDISKYKLKPVPYIGSGISEKILKDTKENVLVNMEFNRFEVHIYDKAADEIELHLNDDLIEAKWFTLEELHSVKQIPGGKEFFRQAGYIK